MVSTDALHVTYMQGILYLFSSCKHKSRFQTAQVISLIIISVQTEQARNKQLIKVWYMYNWTEIIYGSPENIIIMHVPRPVINCVVIHIKW